MYDTLTFVNLCLAFLFGPAEVSFGRPIKDGYSLCFFDVDGNRFSQCHHPRAVTIKFYAFLRGVQTCS